MKSFADWTQEIAQSNAVPGVERSTPSDLHDRNGDGACMGCDGSGTTTAAGSTQTFICRLCSGAGWLEAVKCSGAHCEQKGNPNYSAGPWDDPRYYCGGSPRCCP